MSMSYLSKPVTVCTLHGKRDIADVIKLMILRWGNYLDLFEGPNPVNGYIEEEGRNFNIRRGVMTKINGRLVQTQKSRKVSASRAQEG